MARDSSLKPAVEGRPIDRLLTPFQNFLRTESSGGILLLAATAIALIWANSPWHQSYHDLWHTYVSVGFGEHAMKLSLAHWVNDGLMVIFFFVVGLEIKREVLAGELASPRKAAVPIAAAIGGMVVPALVYVALNVGGPGLDGWAIPAATDIAFALGIITLLGHRVPTSLKVFLTALAIVDDIGAVLIIAIFYTSDISLAALGVAGIVLGLLILANVSGIRRPLVYAVLGIVLWGAFLQSGVHATVAGVVLAFTVPTRYRIKVDEFVSFAQRALGEFQSAGRDRDDTAARARRQSAVHALEVACEHVESPLLRMEHSLLPWVSYVIMPIFALANAGVSLGGGAAEALTSPVGLGIVLGLVVGKQVGVTLATLIAVRADIGQVPTGSTMIQVYGTSWLAGIGFTMSLFIANLAFAEQARLLEAAKIGILAGSLLSGVAGFAILRATTSRRPQEMIHEPDA